MFDVITIGNISFDIFFKGESMTFKDNRFQLAVGGKYFADSVNEALGGGGANVAIGIARHHYKTAILGKIGNNPFKTLILERLRLNKISSHFCQFEDNYINISTILLTKSGERTIIHYETTHQHLLKHLSINQLIDTKMVYLGNLPDVSLTERVDLLHLLKKHCVTTIVNLGVKDCRRDTNQIKKILNFTDILIINGHEFADLIKASYKDIHFKENVVAWYIPYLNTKTVIITEGVKGSYGYFKGKIIHQKAFRPEKIIDTTGAGDAYTAGFITGLLKKYSLSQSMELGAKSASKILAKIGAN